MLGGSAAPAGAVGYYYVRPVAGMDRGLVGRGRGSGKACWETREGTPLLRLLVRRGGQEKPLPGVGAAEGVWVLGRVSGAIGYLGPKA